MSSAAFDRFLEVRDFRICSMPAGSVSCEVDGSLLDRLVIEVEFSSYE